jgi:AraC family transcriptional regulator of adaptative response / DNA-3-methyladenine glycosylase II
MRAIPGVERVDGETYQRTVLSGGVPATLAVAPVRRKSRGRDRAEDRLELRLEPSSGAGLAAIADHVRRMFDLDADPQRVSAVLSRDRHLRRLVRARPGLRVPGAWDGFELAVRAILGQQVSVAAARTLAGRLAERFGVRVDGGAEGLTHLFPTAESLADADLRGIGLTNARAETVRGIARAIVGGTLVLDAPRGLDDAVARLCALPGIGTWTAQYIALRALGERDAFPSGDLGLRRALANGSGMPSTKELERLAEAWRPWRAYAAIHLWTGEAEEKR